MSRPALRKVMLHAYFFENYDYNIWYPILKKVSSNDVIEQQRIKQFLVGDYFRTVTVVSNFYELNVVLFSFLCFPVIASYFIIILPFKVVNVLHWPFVISEQHRKLIVAWFKHCWRWRDRISHGLHSKFTFFIAFIFNEDVGIFVIVLLKLRVIQSILPYISLLKATWMGFRKKLICLLFIKT